MYIYIYIYQYIYTYIYIYIYINTKFFAECGIITASFTTVKYSHHGRSYLYLFSLHKYSMYQTVTLFL